MADASSPVPPKRRSASPAGPSAKRPKVGGRQRSCASRGSSVQLLYDEVPQNGEEDSEGARDIFGALAAGNDDETPPEELGRRSISGRLPIHD